MSGKTGETCQESGLYKCQSHGSNIIPFTKGDTFPACPVGSSSSGHSTTWSLLREA